MLNVTIQNDGKIKFQSECSSTKDMRHNVNLLLAVVSSMETEEAVAKKEANGIPAMKDTLESAGCICRITNGF